MTKGSKPRNYRFLDKYTYYIPDVKGMFIMLAFVLLGGLFGNIISIPFLGIFGLEKGMTYAQLVSYPVTFIPAMIYASVQSRKIGRAHV